MVSQSDYFRVVHTRDSGKPVLLNVLTTGPVKPAAKGMGGGTAVWVLGRQDPFYIRETMEEFLTLWQRSPRGFSQADVDTLAAVEQPATKALGG